MYRIFQTNYFAILWLYLDSVLHYVRKSDRKERIGENFKKNQYQDI